MRIPIILLIFLPFALTHTSEAEIAATLDEKIITCGSVLRIENIMTKFNLHSQKLTWGTGSRQQLVTSVQRSDDSNSLWIIKEKHGSEPCQTGTPVRCGQSIRLEHANTGKNLHSHEYSSFLTDSQEASCFGTDGEGDMNDNFELFCKDQKSDSVVKGKTKFQLFHPATKSFLYINIRKSLYNEYNCRGCPINGEREVSLTKSNDLQNVWKVVGGILFNPMIDDD